MQADRKSTFGDLLRHHREAAGLTQEDLAEQAGMSAQGISALERGSRRRPQRKTILLLAEALGLAGEERGYFETAARKLTRDKTDSFAPERPPSEQQPGPLIDQPAGQQTSSYPLHTVITGPFAPQLSLWRAPGAAGAPGPGAMIAEAAVLAELRRLIPREAYLLPQSLGIYVTLLDGSTFLAQPMMMKEAELRLSRKQIDFWLDAHLLTIPMWWDDQTARVYWADIPRFLLKNGGLSSQEFLPLKREDDLYVLNTKDPLTVDRFLRWIRALSAMWPTLHTYTRNTWLLDREFPVTLIDVLRDPTILSYLPMSTTLIALLEDALGSPVLSHTQIIADLFKAGATALSSPQEAVKRLAARYHIPEGERVLREQLTEHFVQWAGRIAAQSKMEAAVTLRAFDQLIALAGYQAPGHLQLPAFAAAHTYPLGRLVSLLPPETLLNPLIAALTESNDYLVLLGAIYYLGLPNYPRHADIWQLASRIRQHVRSRREQIGEMWPVIERELLYVEAQLGSEKAKEQYLRLLQDKTVLHFENAFNYVYYGRDPATIQQQFERKIDGGGRLDQYMREILVILYDALRKDMSDNAGSLNTIDPRLWPTD